MFAGMPRFVIFTQNEYFSPQTFAELCNWSDIVVYTFAYVLFAQNDITQIWFRPTHFKICVCK